MRGTRGAYCRNRFPVPSLYYFITLCLHHNPTQYTFGIRQFKWTSSSTLFAPSYLLGPSCFSPDNPSLHICILCTFRYVYTYCPRPYLRILMDQNRLIPHVINLPTTSTRPVHQHRVRILIPWGTPPARTSDRWPPRPTYLTPQCPQTTELHNY